MTKDIWEKYKEEHYGDNEYDDMEGYEMWDQKLKYNQKERAKMILDTLDNEPELSKEFHLELRRRKLNKIKK